MSAMRERLRSTSKTPPKPVQPVLKFTRDEGDVDGHWAWVQRFETFDKRLYARAARPLARATATGATLAASRQKLAAKPTLIGSTSAIRFQLA
jgi:hypothetical protein